MPGSKDPGIFHAISLYSLINFKILNLPWLLLPLLVSYQELTRYRKETN